MLQFSKPLPSFEEVSKLLYYNPDEGAIYWKVSPAGNVKPGQRAGAKHHSGYWFMHINGKLYGVHRIAWLLATGSDPGKMAVEHINGKKGDNRLKNLRLATQSQNNCNVKNRRDNTSGVKGVNWNKQHQKWMARVMVNGASHYLGLFKSIEEAEVAIRVKRAELHGDFTNHG